MSKNLQQYCPDCNKFFPIRSDKEMEELGHYGQLCNECIKKEKQKLIDFIERMKPRIP